MIYTADEEEVVVEEESSHQATAAHHRPHQLRPRVIWNIDGEDTTSRLEYYVSESEGEINLQIGWVDVAQGLDSNPTVAFVVVVVVVDAANHANDVIAILIVDVLAMCHPVDVVVCSDVVHLLCYFAM